jgi:hypothetical protein
MITFLICASLWAVVFALGLALFSINPRDEER